MIAAELADTRPLKGIGMTALGYALFSIQDAIVKWLVASYAVPQILFTRSLVIIAVAFAIGGRRNIAALARTRSRGALLARSTLILAAWLLYYNAARSLGLAELTTIYFAAPIIVVILAVVILGERVDAARWLAVLAGFGGVILAARPSAGIGVLPALMAFCAACCWGTSVILVRLINRSEPTTNQMLVSNALFVLACATVLPFVWKMPDLSGLMLMLGLGVAGGFGQYLLFEGFRFAPASALAPIEYSGLVWAFVYGYLIWADVPPERVFAGAVLIVASSLGLVWYERRRALRDALTSGV